MATGTISAELTIMYVVLSMTVHAFANIASVVAQRHFLFVAAFTAYPFMCPFQDEIGLLIVVEYPQRPRVGGMT
jgi:hypothetical protein